MLNTRCLLPGQRHNMARRSVHLHPHLRDLHADLDHGEHHRQPGHPDRLDPSDHDHAGQHALVDDGRMRHSYSCSNSALVSISVKSEWVTERSGTEMLLKVHYCTLTSSGLNDNI